MHCRICQRDIELRLNSLTSKKKEHPCYEKTWCKSGISIFTINSRWHFLNRNSCETEHKISIASPKAKDTNFSEFRVSSRAMKVKMDKCSDNV